MSDWDSPDRRAAGIGPGTAIVERRDLFTTEQTRPTSVPSILGRTDGVTRASASPIAVSGKSLLAAGERRARLIQMP